MPGKSLCWASKHKIANAAPPAGEKNRLYYALVRSSLQLAVVLAEKVSKNNTARDDLALLQLLFQSSSCLPRIFSSCFLIDIVKLESRLAFPFILPTDSKKKEFIMVCIVCYLPPLLFIIYMKFINPIVAPFVAPAINKMFSYFGYNNVLPTSDAAACPIRPSRSKKSESAGDEAGTSAGAKQKDD